MRRREFMRLFGGIVALPSVAIAEDQRIPRIGILWHAANAEEEAIPLTALMQGLNSLGYIEGRTISVEHRFPNEIPERFDRMATELAALNVDLLVAVTRPAAVAAQRATRTIPIVFIVVPDPVGTKLVNSLSHPGGNITGLTNIAVELSGKRLAMFKEAFPQMTRIALLVNANDEAGMRRYIEETEVAATKLDVNVLPVEVRSPGDFEGAFDRIIGDKREGVLLPADGLFYQGRVILAQLALARRLPFMVYNRETLEAGALMSYGPNTSEIFRRAATYIDKILHGEKPASLPVEQPTRFELLVNLKTANALGLTVPQSFVHLADGVVE